MKKKMIYILVTGLMIWSFSGITEARDSYKQKKNRARSSQYSGYSNNNYNNYSNYSYNNNYHSDHYYRDNRGKLCRSNYNYNTGEIRRLERQLSKLTKKLGQIMRKHHRHSHYRHCYCIETIRQLEWDIRNLSRRIQSLRYQSYDRW